VTALVGITVIIGIAVAFFDVTIVWRAFGSLLALLGLGIVSFFLLAVAVVTLIPKSESALPVAYGTMLPLAFISDVFFSSVHAPRWLHDLASAFPVAPIARALEATFDPAADTWPLSTTGLAAVAAWSLAAVLVIAFTFRWEPGPLRWRSTRRLHRKAVKSR
jgi:hypothetical protein